MHKQLALALLAFCVLVISCAKETPEPPPTPGPVPPPAAGVNFDPATVPYATLSAYNFFQGDMADHQPVQGVLPYDVITPLFSDYAKKKKFVWMPGGAPATYAGDHQSLNFPEHTVLIKTFYYDNVQPAGSRRLIETRLLYKLNGQWHFADYVWNSAQTEATLDLAGSNTPVTFTDEQGTERSLLYRIPAEAECLTCHKVNGQATPIGPKPQNLNMPYTYTNGTMGQLARWVQEGYLADGYPSTITTTVRWDDVSQDLNNRVRSYMDMNCAHCHADGRHCDYRPMRFAYEETADPVNLGVCVAPDEPLQPHHTHIVARGSAERSVLHYRMAATNETVRMPLLGRTVVHEEALELIQQWISAMDPPCN
jgi:uncharacterized repeat protein (TIGR03806 family)